MWWLTSQMPAMIPSLKKLKNQAEYLTKIGGPKDSRHHCCLPEYALAGSCIRSRAEIQPKQSSIGCPKRHFSHCTVMSPLLFLYICVLDTSFTLNSFHGCPCTMGAGLDSYNKDPIAHKAQLFTPWFCEKVVQCGPGLSQGIRKLRCAPLSSCL